MTDEHVFLSVEEAISMLPDGDTVRGNWASVWCDETEAIVKNIWGDSLINIADKINNHLEERRLEHKFKSRGHCGLGSVAYKAVEMGIIDEKEAIALLARERRRKPIIKKDREDILKRDRFACLKCGNTQNLQIDHIKPKRFGGEDEYRNYQTLCNSCNAKKGLNEIDYRRPVRKVGRNDKCPCGTGRKYKNCCSCIK